jgi:hypothetical protein
MLNWRRDPGAEQRRIEREIERKQLRSEIAQLKKETEQLRRDNELLAWIESEIDLIEADLPSSSTPPPPIDANSSAC